MAEICSVEEQKKTTHSLPAEQGIGVLSAAAFPARWNIRDGCRVVDAGEGSLKAGWLGVGVHA